jgi:hypothetical protein
MASLKYQVEMSNSSTQSSNLESMDAIDIVGDFDETLHKIVVSTKAKLSERIIINSKGIKHEVLLQALDFVPNSRLSQLKDFIEMRFQKDGSLLQIENICDGHSEDYKEFYFNKDSELVGIILKFYEHDNEDQKVHINMKNLCTLELESAFKFWKIDYEKYLDVCCLRDFNEKKENELHTVKFETETINSHNFREEFGSKFFPEIREKIWYIMEVPKSSIWAKIYIYFSSAIILCSNLDIILS